MINNNISNFPNNKKGETESAITTSFGIAFVF